MSGIYGFVGEKDLEAAVIFRRMREAVPDYGPVSEHKVVGETENMGLGAVHPAGKSNDIVLAEDSKRGICCFFDGVIYREESASGDNLVEREGAEFLLRRYLERGTDCLQHISGSFNVVWWEKNPRRLVLANDKIGQRLLFWGERGEVLVFSTMLARVIGSGIFPRQIDVDGLADLLSFGYILGKRTLFEGIQVLPPASVLINEGGNIRLEQYWRLDRVEAYGQYDKNRLAELEQAFKVAVKRAFRPDESIVLDLTGGVDSRCIFATAVGLQRSFRAETGGQPDSTDVVLARQIAGRAGIAHSFSPIKADRLGEWLGPMVLHQGGMVATLHSHPCEFLEAVSPFQARVQGTGGEFTPGYWLPSERSEEGTDSPIEQYLTGRLIGTKKTRYLSRIWRKGFPGYGTEKPVERVAALLADYDFQNGNLATIQSFYVMERCRKFLNKALMVIRPRQEAYLPYLDHQWLETVAAIPIGERMSNAIQVDLMQSIYHEVLDVPEARSLIPLSASPWQVSVTYRYRGLKRKIGRKVGIKAGPRFVPNHYYSQWIRSDMRPTLEKILRNPEAAFRSYLDGREIDSLVESHFSGEQNWEELVAPLTVFEIAHKMWIEADLSSG